MTPTTLHALRRLLFFTLHDVGHLIAAAANQTQDVSEETWRRWENGEAPIPPNIAAKILELNDWRSMALAATADNIRAQIKEKGGLPESVFVIWYDNLEDWLSLPNRESVMWRPQQAVCASLMGLFSIIKLVRFDLSNYTAWRGEREDSDTLRAEWASSISI